MYALFSEMALRRTAAAIFQGGLTASQRQNMRRMNVVSVTWNFCRMGITTDK